MSELRTISRHRVIGAAAFVIGLAALILWLLNDVDSGLIERVRRRYQIGDMLGPVVALATIMLGGVWLCLSQDRQPVGKIIAPARAIAVFIAVVALSLLLMRWAGPAVVWLGEMAGLIEPGTGYRPLRDTLP